MIRKASAGAAGRLFGRQRRAFDLSLVAKKPGPRRRAHSPDRVTAPLRWEAIGAPGGLS